MKSPLLILLVISACATGCLSMQRNATTGFKVSVALSNYSNPHQVLAETGVACDASSNCDPYFVIKLGTQQYSFEWENTSRVFANALDLSGEFFRTEFQLNQELPDALFISVTILDHDPFDSHETIARPVVELLGLLPTIPGRSSSMRRAVTWTPENRLVEFTLTAEAHCLPGLYGRRCSTLCNGEPIYPACNRDNRCSDSGLDLIGCGTAEATAERSSADKVSDQMVLTVSLNKRPVIIGIASAAAGLLAVAVILVARTLRRKRRDRSRLLNDYRLSIQQQSSTVDESAPPRSPMAVESYRNPVYTRGHSQYAPAPQASAAPPPQVPDSGTNDSEEVYEDVEEQKTDRPPPLLPPRQSSTVQDSSNRAGHRSTGHH